MVVYDIAAVLPSPRARAHGTKKHTDRITSNSKSIARRMCCFHPTHTSWHRASRFSLAPPLQETTEYQSTRDKPILPIQNEAIQSSDYSRRSHQNSDGLCHSSSRNSDQEVPLLANASRPKTAMDGTANIQHSTISNSGQYGVGERISLHLQDGEQWDCRHDERDGSNLVVVVKGYNIRGQPTRICCHYGLCL